MKARESGMPDEAMWSGFFCPTDTLRALGLAPATSDVVDFGCGYGTFTLPAAEIIRGTVHALDINAQMVATVASKAGSAKLDNVRVEQRDFFLDGSGLANQSIDYAMLFNILHCQQPELLLREAYRVLAPQGRLGVMHWNDDASTPRGPSMDIRPTPEQCRDWAVQVGFQVAPRSGPIDLPPYHFGWVLEKA